MRAGESEFESMGVINTNPVEKTSVDSGLSERGKKQSIKAAFDLKEMGACDKGCWIWSAITQRAYQTAEIIASVNGVTRRFVCLFVLFFSLFNLPPYIIPMHPNFQNLTILVNFFHFSYIVPEYSFLDARGLGAFEGKKLEYVSEVGFLSQLFSSNSTPIKCF